MADIKGESGGAPVSQDGAPVLEAEDLCSSADIKPLGQVLNDILAHQLAVSEDGDPVTDLVYLLQEVGDKIPQGRGRGAHQGC